jgi:hypothetical protein
LFNDYYAAKLQKQIKTNEKQRLQFGYKANSSLKLPSDYGCWYPFFLIFARKWVEKFGGFDKRL